MDGWQARTQLMEARCRPGAHRSLPSQQRDWNKDSLQSEQITLCIPLSGRVDLWPRCVEFLEGQSWPHAQIKLLLLDTSRDRAFSHAVRTWLMSCDYDDVRYVRLVVGRRGLADCDRQETHSEVALAMARIYNRVAREVTSDFIWVLEDDIIPPLDCCERLLAGFDDQTASVSAAYRSRQPDIFMVWDHDCEPFSTAGNGIQQIGGNGFGCVILRRSVIQRAVFTASLDFAMYDCAFYYRLRTTGMAAKVNWSVQCDHLQSRHGGQCHGPSTVPFASGD
jgi:hypothetical protein